MAYRIYKGDTPLIQQPKIGNLNFGRAYVGNQLAYGAAPIVLLLDAYPGAVGGYSLRKLKTDYSGNAITVRRSSDSNTQDIGFDDNGDLDTTALDSFCSGADGFVTTWYNQGVEGQNATQPTAGEQPKIYDSSTGVIVDSSTGKPTIQFDGSTDSLDIPSLFSSQPDVSTYVVGNSRNEVNGRFVAYNQDDIYFRIEVESAGYNWRFVARQVGGSEPQITSATSNTTYSLIEFYINQSGTNQAYLNNSSQGTIAFGDSETTTLGPNARIGSNRNDSANFLDGYVQEVILYPSSQQSNRTGITSDINTYYSIY